MSNLGGKINFQLGYSIDKSALDALTKEFDRITIAATKPGKNLSQSLKDAREAANVLGSSMKAAFDINKGSVNLSKFNSYISQSGKSMSQLSQNLTKAGINGEGAFAKLNSSLMTANTTITKTQTAFGKMTDTFLSAAYWGAAYRAINSISSGISNAVKYVEELDTSLNKIRIVTGDSAEKMEQFAISANKAAQSLGASTKAYVDASLIFYEQGLSDKEVEARTNITMKVANVTDLNAEEAAENLTAVWNGFKISTDDAEKVIDQLAAVAANSASNLGELSTAMSKVASAANTMGVGTEQLTAMLATVEEATRQAPESIGTAYKTIFARMGDLKTDGVDEFGTTLGEVSTQMKTMGIDIIDDTGAMKDMGQVVEETAEAWKGWSREQKQAAAIAMAGKRQYNNLFALFENWDRYTENLDVATNSLGTLQKQQDTYLESTAAKLKQVQAQWEEFYSNLIDSDALKLFIEGFEQVAKQVNNLTTTPFGTLVPIFSTLAILLNGKISKGLTNFVTGNTKAVQQARELKVLEESIAATKARYESSGGISAKTVLSSQMSANAGGNVAEATIIANLKKQALSLQKEMTIEEQQTLNTLIRQTGEEQKQQISRAKKVQNALNEYNLSNQQLKVESEEVNTTKLRSEFFDLTTKNLEKQVGLLLNGKTLSQEELNTITKRTSLLEEGLRIELDRLKEEEDIIKLILEEDELTTEEMNLNRENLEIIAKQRSLYSSMINQLGNIEHVTREILEENEGIITSTESIGIRLNSFDKQAKISTFFSSITSGAAGAVLGITSFISAYNTLKETDISPMEKFTQVSMSLAIGLPMLTSGLRGLSQAVSFFKKQSIESLTYKMEELEIEQYVIGFQNKEEKARMKTAIAQAIQNSKTKEALRLKLANLGLSNEEIEAFMREITAQKIYNASKWEEVKGEMAAKMAKLGYIAVAVAAVAAIGALVYWSVKYNEAQKTNIERTEDAKKALSEQANIVKEVQNNYKELKDTIDNLKNSRSALSQMTEGTQEWRDAVYELNSQVLQLTEKYPKLLDYITNKNGVLGIKNEGFDELLKIQQKGIEAAQSRQFERQADVFRLQAAAAEDKIKQLGYNIFAENEQENRRKYSNDDNKATSQYDYEKNILNSEVIKSIAKAYSEGSISTIEDLKQYSGLENLNDKNFQTVIEYVQEIVQNQEQSLKMEAESLKTTLQQNSLNYQQLNTDVEKDSYSQLFANNLSELKEGIMSSFDVVTARNESKYNVFKGDEDEGYFRGTDGAHGLIIADYNMFGQSSKFEEDFKKVFKEGLTEATKDSLSKLTSEDVDYKQILAKQYGVSREDVQVDDTRTNDESTTFKINDNEITVETEKMVREVHYEILKKAIEFQYGSAFKDIAQKTVENSALVEYLNKEGPRSLKAYTDEQLEKLRNSNLTDKEAKLMGFENNKKFSEQVKKDIDQRNRLLDSSYSVYEATTEQYDNYLKIIKEDKDTTSISSFEKAGSFLSRIDDEKNKQVIDEFFKNIEPDKYAEALNVLSDFDPALGEEELTKQLKDAKLGVDDFGDSLSKMIDVLESANSASLASTYNINTLTEGLSAYKQYAKDIKAGDTVTSSDYKNMIKMLDEKAQNKVAALFAQTEGGDFMYVGGDASDLQTAMFGTNDIGQMIKGMAAAQTGYEKILDKFNEGQYNDAYAFAKGQGENEQVLGNKDKRRLFGRISGASTGGEQSKTDKAFEEYILQTDARASYLTLKEKLSGLKTTDDYGNFDMSKVSKEEEELINTLLENVFEKANEYIGQGESGQWDIHNESTREKLYGSLINLSDIKGAITDADDTIDTEVGSAYEKARQRVLQENLKNLDSNLAAEKEYQETLAKTNKNLEENTQLLEENAQTNFRIKSGITALSKIWYNTYKDAEKGSKEYSEALAETKDVINSMFDVDVTDSFVANSNNLNMIKQAAKGSKKALEDLRIEATKDYVINVRLTDEKLTDDYDNLINFIINNPLPDIEVGVETKTGDFYNKLQEIVSSTELTADEIQKIMTSAFNISVDLEKKDGGYNLVSYARLADPRNLKKDYEAGLGKSDRNKKESSTYNYIEKAEYDGDIYHNINEKLENIERTMSRLETHQDDLWGSQALKNIDKINDALKSNINLLEKRIKVGRKDLSEKKGQLIADFNVQFDKSGNISNYNKVYDKLYKSREKLRRKYNAMSAAAQSETAGKQLKKDIEVYDKRIDLYKKEAEAYEKIYDQIENDRSKIDELHRKEIENALKKIDLSIELKVEPSEIQRSYRDFLKKTQVADNDFASISKMQLKDYKSYGKEIKERHKQINNLTKSLKNFQKAGKDKTFNNGLKDAKDKLKDLIKDQEQALITLSELESSMIETMNNNFSELSKNFDKINEKYNNIMSNINHFSDITKLLLGEDNYAAQEKFFKQRDIANRSQIKSLKNQLKIYEAERINIENKIAKETNEKQKQNLQNSLDTVNSQITQMQNQLQSSINETFQNLIDGYKNSIDAIFKEVELELTNGLGIDTVQDGIKKTKDYSDEWLDDVQKIYEINKLTAAYDDAARKETELGLQNKILQAKREEIALLQKQGKLEQYDIDRANAKLNLLLKEIALQEARENKTKLRLRRDAQGNYSYQYTANQEDIDKARQEYEDALYKLNELDQKQRLSLNDRLLTLETDWTKALQEIYEDYSMQENEKEQRIANINEYYEKERNNLLEGNDEILRNLYESSLVYFNRENETYFKSYDEMTQEWKDKFNDFIYGPQGLIPNQKNGFGLMKTDMNSWKTSFSNAIDSAKSKNKDLKDDLDSVAKLAGESYQKILKGEEDGNAGIEDVKSATNELETATKDLGTEYENTSTKINKAWNELQTFQEKINEQKYTKAIKEASKLAAAMGKVKTQADKATESTKNVKAAAASKTETYVPTDTSSGSSGGSSGSGSYNLTEYNSKKTENRVSNLANKKIQKGDKVKWTNPDKINHSEFDLYRDSTLKKTQGLPGSKQQNWLGKFFKNAGSQKVNSLPSSNEAKVIGYQNGKVKIEFKAMTQSLKEIGKPLGWSYRTVKGWISEKTFKDRFTGYDTGGYTGSWNSKDGKLALLHEKELVLNKQDTSNMLQAINQLRDIQSTLGLNANDVLNSIIKDFTTTLKGMNINNSKATNQNITISANFPNAIDRFEIEAAFDSLEARASQYAWSKDLDA